MKGVKTWFFFGSLSVATATFPVHGNGFDWSTGQGLIDTCTAISIPHDKASDEDAAKVMLCVTQFKIWRDSWNFADAYNESTFI
ncbi:hypothetical protein [Pseudomonas sp. PAB10]|uniref:hypothetical protein n=1 Tax=Pseudomonas sp. PAB10 TaxID=3233047 RepID=UPI003F994257